MIFDDFTATNVLSVNNVVDFFIDVLGGLFTVVLSASNFFTEEDVVLVFTEGDEADVAHTPVADHVASEFGSHFDVAGGTAGDVTDGEFFGYAATHCAANLVKDAAFLLVKDVLFRHEHGAAEALSARDDGYLVDGEVVIVDSYLDEGVACFVVGGDRSEERRVGKECRL